MTSNLPDFLGHGWSFPIQAESVTDPATNQAEVRIAEASDAQKIRQSIWMILSTAPGERPMRADFGCGIHDLVFAVFNDATIGQVMNAVAQALGKWEPRIDVLGIDVAPDPDEPNVLLIAIDYSIRSTNSRFNLVYPFYVS
jgi:phage baseplate assembly protein W